MSSSMPSSPWFAVSMSLLGVIVGYGLATAHIGLPAGAPAPAAAPSAPTAPAAAGPVKPVDASDHVRGDKNAKISLIEYSDYECPFCKRHHPTMLKLFETYKNDVNWVYRHFPLSFHQNAQKEAEASECVAELGGNDAFWNFTDKIYERTTSNGTGFALDKLGPLAKEVGVDQAKFQTCLDSGKYATLVQDEESGGVSAGIHGTPGTVIYDNETKESKLVSGAVSFDSFKASIDAMLK
jgi:protein-disulfide isomerase